MKDEWVVVVYDGGDKVGSHIFHGKSEEEVRVVAESWVTANFWQGADWSLHHVSDQ